MEQPTKVLAAFLFERLGRGVECETHVPRLGRLASHDMSSSRPMCQKPKTHHLEFASDRRSPYTRHSHYAKKKELKKN